MWWCLLSCSHSVVSDSSNLMDGSPPGSSVHGVSQARTQEWVAISSCRDLSDPGIVPSPLRSPVLAGRFFTTSATWGALGMQQAQEISTAKLTLERQGLGPREGCRAVPPPHLDPVAARSAGMHLALTGAQPAGTTSSLTFQMWHRGSEA